MSESRRALTIHFRSRESLFVPLENKGARAARNCANLPNQDASRTAKFLLQSKRPQSLLSVLLLLRILINFITISVVAASSARAHSNCDRRIIKFGWSDANNSRASSCNAIKRRRGRCQCTPANARSSFMLFRKVVKCSPVPYRIQRQRAPLKKRP